MKLYLVQHGDAVDKDTNPERPLSEQGKADVNRLSVFLRKNNIQVERVMHSGKLRAAQTVERLLNSVSTGVDAETSVLLAPNASVEAFTELSFMWSEDTLLVGHLPFLAKLISQLCFQNNTVSIVEFKPGTCVCLERNEANLWHLTWMVRPENLK